MILINKSPTADTRTCDVSKVSKEQLLDSSKMHIKDVESGMFFFANKLTQQSKKHDFDKIENIDEFFVDFKNNFETHSWWDNHRKVNRHHLNKEDGVPKDVNLLDVFEYITDCVMAGLARSGEVYDITIKDEVLQKAFANTVKLLKDNVQVLS